MSIETILERVGKVKLSGGIFGKMTWAVIVICICATTLAIATTNLYVISCTILAMLGFALHFFNKLLKFAEKNPQAAILDGAEFVMHEQIMHAQKGEGNLPPQPSTIDHVQPEIDPAVVEADDADAAKSIERR